MQDDSSTPKRDQLLWHSKADEHFLARRQTCAQCSRPIPQKQRRPRTKYCSDKCSHIANNKRYTCTYDEHLNLNAAQKGAISELIVCADLIKRGYDVYRAVSPRSAADLVAVRNDRAIRVEVKTGLVLQSGKVCYPHNLTEGTRNDVYAIVLNDHILYKPELE